MVNAIRAVNSGQRYISPEIAQQMALSQFRLRLKIHSLIHLNELQIMMMITKGQKVILTFQNNSAPSLKTVNSHRYWLFSKLDISGDVELTHLAIRHGMLDIGDFNSEIL